MVSKEDIRISGVYGKKIIDSIDMPLVRKSLTTWHYQSGKNNFYYYPKSRKIYISSPDSDSKYNILLNKINSYLDSLANLPEEVYFKTMMLEMLNLKTSLHSEYHIFNAEVYISLIKTKYERLKYAKELISSYRYLTLPFYEELLLSLLYLESDKQVNDIYTKMCNSKSEVEKYKIWEEYNSDIMEEEKQLIKQKLNKIKLEGN